MIASELYTSLSRHSVRVLSLNDAVRCYTLQLRENAMQYIDECRAAERERSDSLISLPHRHIAQLYSSAPIVLHVELSCILSESDRMRAEAIRVLSPKDLLEFFKALESLSETCSKTARALSRLCDDIVPRYLARLQEAAQTEAFRSYTYEIPSALILELDTIIL